MFEKLQNQKGFAVYLAAILLLTALIGIGVSLTFLTLGEYRVSGGIVKSSQAYFAAESGIEDGIYRIKKSLNIPSSYSIAVGQASVDVSVDSSDPSRWVVTANGKKAANYRKVEARLMVAGSEFDFSFGGQAGDMGILMGNGSRIETAAGPGASLYSNGSIEGGNGATITGDVFVAAGVLKDVIIYGDAHANTIDDSYVCGDAYYQTIDTTSLNFLNNPTKQGCPEPLTPGTAFPQSAAPPLKSLPISAAQINQWKQEAAAGGIRYGDLVISTSTSYGPKKIQGNLIMNSNNKILTVNGTIYVTGYIDISNGSTIRCSPSFGSLSCIVISDKWIHTQNNGVFQGSGQSGSYILILTTSLCNGGLWPSWPTCTYHNAAIDLVNNAAGAIFYANDGLIYLHPGIEASQITAKKINLQENATIRYEQGVGGAHFSSAPVGGWEVESWKEVE
jgi:hypothetical protein